MLNAKQPTIISNRQVTLSAYGQANLGISATTNVIVSAVTTDYLVHLMVENSASYNYWVYVTKTDGTVVKNATIKLSIMYFTP